MTAAEQLRNEGRNEGRQERQRANLLLLLSERFGPLPELILARIYRADLAQLQCWFEQGITAQSLDIVFSDEP